MGQHGAHVRHLGAKMCTLGAQMSQLEAQMEVQIGSNGPQFVSFELKVGLFELQVSPSEP